MQTVMVETLSSSDQNISFVFLSLEMVAKPKSFSFVKYTYRSKCTVNNIRRLTSVSNKSVSHYLQFRVINSRIVNAECNNLHDGCLIKKIAVQ